MGITDIRIATISKGSQIHIPSVFADIGIGKGASVMIIGYEDKIEIRPAGDSLKMIQDVLNGNVQIPVKEEAEKEEGAFELPLNDGSEEAEMKVLSEEELAETDIDEGDVVSETLDENFVMEDEVGKETDENGDLLTY